MTEAMTRSEPGPGSRRASFDAMRTERWVATIRLAIVLLVSAIYLGSAWDGDGPSLPAIALLSFADLYAVWSLVAFAGPQELAAWPKVLSVVVDAALVTAWVSMTGGAHSEYWGLYLVVVISVAMRFGLIEAVVASAGVSIVYGAVALAEGSLAMELVLHRISLFVITGFAAGVLSQQRHVHRRRGQEFQAVAEERSRELTVERAEVERLRRVDLAKSEFVAIAAHEFRTPLAAVIGVLTTLDDHGGQLSAAERTELIEGATAQASRLARLVDDLLTIARIEDGVVRLDLEPVEPGDLLAEATEASGMTGRLVVSAEPVGRVVCDRDAIVRVLTNLLDNAGKYSPEGSEVHITVCAEGELVRFAVADQGPGIPEDERAEVFERFRRLDGASSRQGTGLGLYICRGLIEAHGGTIDVGDGSRGGAEFSFALPLATPEEASGPDGLGRGMGAGGAADPEGLVEVPPAAVR